MSDRPQRGLQLTPVTTTSLVVGALAATIIGVLIGMIFSVGAGILIGLLILVAVFVVTAAAIETADPVAHDTMSQPEMPTLLIEAPDDLPDQE